MTVTPGLSFGRAMVMAQSATAVPHRRARPSGSANLSDARILGSWQSRARAAPGPWPGGGRRGLDKAVASQQGRRVGLSWSVGRAMDLPADESTSAATQWLQQALKQGAGGRLSLDLGGSW
jgi:hypothetical protein